MNKSPNANRPGFSVIDDGKKSFIPFLRIIYFEALKDYTLLCTIDAKIHASSYRMKEVEQIVEESQLFLRIHKTFLVNMAYILRFESEKQRLYCRMEGGRRLPVAQDRDIDYSRLLAIRLRPIPVFNLPFWRPEH